MMEGADSEEKREPASDIDTAAADSLKVLDPKRPIREADINFSRQLVHQQPLFVTGWRLKTVLT
jgi:hypothetical protein